MDNPLVSRSDLMEEVVSRQPGFIVRFGNMILMATLLLLFSVFWFIEYPETIIAPATLTSINAPKPVVSLVDGKLVRLLVTENESVHTGQIIAFIESTAKHEDVLQLGLSLDSIRHLLDQHKAHLAAPYFDGVSHVLGELQAPYQALSEAFMTYNSYLPAGFHAKKRSMLVRDLHNLALRKDNITEQKLLNEQDLVLVQQHFEMNKRLREERVISDADYRVEQRKLIDKELTIPEMKSMILQIDGEISEKEKEMMELDNTIDQQELLFRQAFNTFVSRYDDWKRKYVLSAPIDGHVVFSSFVQENQYLHANETICFVTKGGSQYFAEARIPQSNFGKVEVGQKVLLRFESYPFDEFGSVVGKVEMIKRIPGESGYMAKIVLTKELTTTFGKQIVYRDGLRANAEIVTTDLRLLERLYYRLRPQIR